jgi:PAS domain S-box-containing protein
MIDSAHLAHTKEPAATKPGATRAGVSLFSSLRARLSLILILALIPALFFLVFDALAIRQRIHTEVQAELLRLGQFVARSYTESLDSVHRLLATIALDADVTSAAQGGDRAACTTRLAKFTELNPGTVGFGLWDLDGNLLCAQQAFTTTVNASDRLWFQQARQSQAFAIGHFQLSRPTQVPTLAFGYPVHDQQGVLRAILSTGWNLDELNQTADWSNFPADAVVTIFDAQGAILARNHDFEAWVGHQRPDGSFEQMRTQGEGVIQAVGADGVERLYGFTPIIGPGGAQVWLSIGRMPSVIYAGVSQVIVRDLLGIAAILLAALVAVWVGSDRLLLRKIDQLVGASNRLAAGDWQARAPASAHLDELDHLALTFNQMADTLQHREAELLARERYLGLALESARMVAWTWNPIQNRLRATDNFVDLYGVAADEYARQGFTWIHPEDRTWYEPLVMQAVHERVRYHAEFRILRPDQAQPLWLEERAVPVLDDAGDLQAFAGVVMDITERKAADAALRQSEARFRSLFTSNMTPMGVWTRAGDIVDANDSLLALLGYTRQELAAGQLKWRDLTPPEYVALDERALAEIEAKGVCTPFEKAYIRKDGRQVPILLGGGRFDDQAASGIFFAVDLSEKKAAEAALRLARDQAEQAAERVARLQQITALLANTLTPAEVTRVMVRESMSALGASAGMIVLITPDGAALELTEVQGYPPALTEPWRHFPLTTPVPIADAARTGEFVLLESRAMRSARYPHLPERPRDGDNQAWASIPLVTEERTFGALGLSFPTARTFSTEERELMLALSRLCAQALERTRLYEAEQEARTAADAAARASAALAERIGRLQTVTAAFARALNPQQVSQVLLSEGVAGRGVKSWTIYMASEDGQFLEDLQGWGERFPVGDLYRRIPLTRALPVTDAFRTGQPVWITSQQAYLTTYPQLREHILALEAEAAAAIPLIFAGRATGVLALSFAEVQAFTDDEQDFLLALAQQGAQALERARLYEAEQQARAKLELRVQERTAELERSNRELDQFAYIASHDLKSPLRGIEHLTNFLIEDAAPLLPEASQRHLSLIRSRIKRMEALLNDLLAYARAGRHRYAPERLEPATLIRETVELLAPPPGFVVEIVEPMPVLVGERVPLELIFRNLIGNAVKHHHQPSQGRVRIHMIKQDDWVQVTVADNGPGIDPAFHARIFEIFQTLKPRDQVEGSGIGLTVVKKMVEARGGTIWVESIPGEGAIFSFTWPKQVMGS